MAFSERAEAHECGRDDGYNSRGHRFGQFYDKLCCICATKQGFDLTISNYGGCCANCLTNNINDLKSHPHLHLDALCAKLSNMIYQSKDLGNSLRSRLQDHFEIIAENKIDGDQTVDGSTVTEKPGPCYLVLRALFKLPLIRKAPHTRLPLVKCNICVNHMTERLPLWTTLQLWCSGAHKR